MAIERSDVIDVINQAIEDGVRTIILCAPGGYGKSYIAMECCKKSALRFSTFLSSKGDLRVQLKNVFQRVYPNENVHDDMVDGAFAYFLYEQLDSYYSRSEENWVITYDDTTLSRRNFKKFVDEYVYIPRKKSAKGLVIITTQNCWGYKNENVKVINVPRIEKSIASNYLRETIPEITDSDINEIELVTGCIALPISLAGASILRKSKLKRLDISAAVNEFCKEVTTASAYLPNDIDYDKNLYKAILVTVNNICEYESNPDNIYDLLICTAITAPTQFERQVIYTELLKIDDWENAQLAIARWNLFEHPDSFTMHPTTQDILLYIDLNRDKEAFFSRLCRAAHAFILLCSPDDKRRDGAISIQRAKNQDLNDQFSSEFETAKRLEQLLYNAINQAESSKYYSQLCDYLYTVSYGIAFYYYRYSNNFSVRERYYYYAYKAVEKELQTLPGDNILLYRKAAQLKYRGVSLRAIDKNEEAIKCYNDALNIYNSIEDSFKDSTWHKLAVEIYYNRGLVKSDECNNTNVLDDYNRSLNIATEYRLDASVPQRCLGIYYRDTGNYAEAIKCFEKSIEIGGGDENIARCYTNLGLLYIMKNGKDDLSESEKSTEKAIGIHKCLRGQAETVPLLNMELCKRMQNDDSASKNCLVEAAKVIFGDSDDSIATSLEKVLCGTPELIDLNVGDYHWDKTGCMLLCTHCIDYLMYKFGNIKDNKNIESLLNIAFEVRDSKFKNLRSSIIALDSGSNIDSSIIEQVKVLTNTVIYNKLTCAVLMRTCSAVYLNCGDDSKALLFAYASYFLYNAYSYEYGIQATKRLIEKIKEPLKHI